MKKDTSKVNFSSMSVAELKAALLSLRKKVADARLDLNNTDKSADISVFKKVKKDIARCLTALAVLSNDSKKVVKK